MKKFLLIPIMTMLCSVMAWAVDVADKEDLAVAIATENAAITLTADITLDPGTLDLNGATISCGANKLVFATENGTYTLQNGTFASGTTAISISGSGVTLSLENISIENTVSTGLGISSVATLNIDANSVINCTAYQDIDLGANAAVTINNYGKIQGKGLNQTTSSSLVSSLHNYEEAIYKQQKAYKQVLNVINDGSIEFKNGAQVGGAINVTNNGTFSVTGNTAKILANGTLHITNNGTATISNGQHGPGNLILDGSNNTTISGGTIYNTLNITINEGGEATISGGGFQGPTIVNNGTATISGGTFNTNATTFNGTNNTLITGGTFEVAPEGTMGYIEPVTNCTFVEGVGELTIAEGYVWRESDGLIVVAPPTTVAATLKHLGGSQNYAYVEDAFNDAVSGDSIILMDDYTTSSSIWIGTSGVSDPSRTLVFDLNGHTLTSASSIVQTFTLMHGKLYVINSVPGQGEIVNSNSSGKIFFVQGTYQKNCNPRIAAISDLFTYLKIEEGVTLNATGSGGSAIVVDYIKNAANGRNSYTTKYISASTNNAVSKGLANGVRVDVKGNIQANKYGIKINGNVVYPNPDFYSRTNDDSGSTVAESDTIYSSFIHVYPSATITMPSDVEEATPVYSSGYGRFLVEGTCKGATGVYVKSGFVVLNNAIVESIWKDAAFVVSGSLSGIKAGGNAIVVEADAEEVGYPGHAVLIVNGDTKAQTSATGGAALVDAIEALGNSKIDSVIINGGTFVGPYAIVISEQTATSADAKVVIKGVSLVGATEVANETGEAAVNSIIDLDEYHTTVVGNTLIVSKGGTDPMEITNFGTSADPQEDEIVDIAKQQDRPDANWTGTNSGEVSEGTTVALGELQIISGTSENGGQQLTVGENATLQVERLIMNEYATIVVEAGGKLIVDGTQGINAPDVENITLQSSEEKQAIFLFHPEVSSNRHPMATVQMISKAYRKEDGKYVYQRFGVPSYMDGITRADMHYTSPTAVYKLNYESQQWESMAMTDEFIPFQCYELTTTDAAPGAVYTFQCPLTGNSDAELVLQDKWNYYANSYSAPINIKQMINRFAEDNADAVDPTVYVYDPELDWWKAVNNGNLWRSGTPQEIAPMQAFIFKRVGNGENPNISYNEHVWTPIVDPSNVQFAPSRNRNNMSTAIIEIQDANGKKDVVTLMEGNQFSEDYDLTYDATKYINTRSFNFYVSAEEPMEMVATDNLEGNVLNLTTKDQTSFTMTFREVNGMEYAIRDMLTGTETAIVEGATYMFSTAANSTVEGRFVIVPVAKMPTAIDHIEATAATKGIYTISGQFVGYDYHALPMGVYVVDGKKIVK